MDTSRASPEFAAKRDVDVQRLIDEGNAAEDAGRLEDALRSYEAATRLEPQSSRSHLNRGNALAALGRFHQALASYETALEHQPNHAGTHANVGNVLLRLDRYDEAIARYRRALQIDAGMPTVSLALALALQQLGRPDESIQVLRDAIALEPTYAELHAGLGDVLCRSDQAAKAAESLRTAAKLAPSSPNVAVSLGNALATMGRLEEALAEFRRAVEIAPSFPEAHLSMGKALLDLQQLTEAAASFRKVLSIDARHGEALTNLAVTLRDLNQPNEAMEVFDAALKLRPSDSKTHASYGILLQLCGRLEDAIAHHRTALEAGGDVVPEVRNNLGNALMQSGRFAEAIEEFRCATELRPKFWSARSNLLLAMNYMAVDAAECLREATSFGSTVAAATRFQFTSWPASSRPDRLRIGIVSGDLRIHPVGYFFESLAAHCSSARIELLAYPTFGKEDELTARIRKSFASWKPLTGLGDEAAARLIRDDGVHVLIDLSGHTAYNRLPMFAFRPAPVQASWLGYFATTGIDAMDYLLCDRRVAPESEAGHFIERPWHLPDSYLCFTPPASAVTIGPLPALAAGHVTFGCFNNLAKINDGVVRLWSRVLHRVPTATLMLKTMQLADEKTREETLRRFETAGVARHRVILEPPSSRHQLLDAYNRVDIALDPFPYPGGTTTAEAYWMGVPTITRKGDRFLSHVGESIAHAAGMPDWIAESDDAYVEKAALFGSDLGILAHIRASLRQQVLKSPLFDGARFAGAFESAMWGMWNVHAGRAVK